jgi:hypothetical protein
MQANKYAPSTVSDNQTAMVAALMPSDRAALIQLAAQAISDFDVAVIAGEAASCDAAMSRYDAAVWKLNGGTFTGAEMDDDSAGTVLERETAARAGTTPKWGQSGEFQIRVSGLRSVLRVSHRLRIRAHFEFHAIDSDRPYISETGYRSHFAAVPFGRTVTEAAELIFAEFIADGQRMIHRDHLPLRPFGWLDSQDAAQVIDRHESEAAQAAFAF